MADDDKKAISLMKQSTALYLYRFERDFVARTVTNQREFIKTLQNRVNELTAQINKLNEEIELQGGETHGLRQIKEQLQATVAALQSNIEQARAELENHEIQLSRYSRVMRIFLEYGDNTRLQLLTYLQQAYPVELGRMELHQLKATLQNLLAALPDPEAQELEKHMNELEKHMNELQTQ